MAAEENINKLINENAASRKRNQRNIISGVINNGGNGAAIYVCETVSANG